jgi:hypothetical protein
VDAESGGAGVPGGRLRDLSRGEFSLLGVYLLVPSLGVSPPGRSGKGVPYVANAPMRFSFRTRNCLTAFAARADSAAVNSSSNAATTKP